MTYQVEAFDLDYKGQGITKINDKITFVKNLFEGEVALVTIDKTYKNYQEASVVEYIKRSPNRVSDTYFDYAPLAGLSLASECLWQEKITKETLKKIGNLDVNVSDTITDGIKTHYRNKVTLHVVKKDKLVVGVYKANSRALVHIDTHLLVKPILNETIQKINALFETYTFIDDTLKHMTLRTNGHEVMVILSIRIKAYKEKDMLVMLLKPICDSIYLSLSPNDYEILGDEVLHIYGKKTLPVNFGPLTYDIGPVGFFQVNEPISLKMYEFIKQHITGKNVLDAYAGMATIGQFLGQAFNVVAIESNHDAVIQAKDQINKNQLKNITIIEGDVNIEINNYIDQMDSIVFDPPRSGLDSDTVELLLAHDIKQIIYVSCDIKTLTRDLKMLSSRYDIISITPFRMFPSTDHVETITLLSLKTS